MTQHSGGFTQVKIHVLAHDTLVITCVTSPTLRFELSDGLEVAATTDPGDPLLAEFFEAYDRAFILPSEKEGWDGFVECLKLNHGDAYARLASIWGPFREWVLLMRAGVAGETIIGGANLVCFPLRTGENSVVLSMNLNYLFVDPQQRRRGYLRKMINACQDVVRRSFPSVAASVPLLMFLEQNDPLKLTPEEYARDSFHAGIDQVDRIRIWRHAGARIIDFAYVQPALSDEQHADMGLMLSVAGVEGDALDACVLHLHLERFFAISVLKGRDPRTESTACEQLILSETACGAHSTFSLLDPQPWLDSLRSGPPYDLPRAFSAGSLRNRLRLPDGTREHPFEEKNAVLEYATPDDTGKPPEIAIALHFVEHDVPDDSPNAAGPNVFTSMEMDLLAYQFQLPIDKRALKSHCALAGYRNLSITFPEKYCYYTEGSEYWLSGRSELKTQLKLSCTDFQSGVRVWHCVISPAKGAKFNEFDIIKLMHLYDGRSESTEFCKNEKVRFVLDDSTRTIAGARDLLNELLPRAIQVDETEEVGKADENFIGGTIQLNPSIKYRDDHKRLTTVHEARTEIDKDDALGKLKTTISARLLALAGVVTGIFDFKNVEIEELLDTLEPTYTDGEIFIRINRCSLIGYVPDDRVLRKEQVHTQIGISPYLLLPHAAIIHNEALVRRAERRLKKIERDLKSAWHDPRLFVFAEYIRDLLRRPICDFFSKRRKTNGRQGNSGSPSLPELEQEFDKASAHLEEQQLQNIFNYITERTLFGAGMLARGAVDKRRAVLARHRDTKEKIDSLWKWQNEWSQIWQVAFLGAIGAIALRFVIEPIEMAWRGKIDAAPYIVVVLVVIVFLVVIYIRGVGVRNKSSKPKRSPASDASAEAVVSVKPSSHKH